MADEWDLDGLGTGADPSSDDFDLGLDLELEYETDGFSDADPGDFSLEDILREYGGSAEPGDAPYETPADETPADEAPADEAPADEAPDNTSDDDTVVFPRNAEDIAERSRRIAMDTFGQTLRQYQRAETPPDSEPQAAQTPADDGASGGDTIRFTVPLKTDGRKTPSEPESESESKPEPESPAAAQSRHPKVTVGEDGVITLEYEDGAAPESDLSGETIRFEPQAGRASGENSGSPDTPDGAAEDFRLDGDGGDAGPDPSPRRAASSAARAERPGFSERFLAPVVRLLATRLARRQLQNAEATNWPDPVEIRETPELSPRKAAKFYARMAGNIRLRCRIAFFLCLILTWISLRLPMAGMLGKSTPLQAGACLVLTLAVMMAALDVVSAGLRQLFELRPGMEALASAAAILSCIDAAAVLGSWSENLPFCAVGAFALTTALWSQRLTCTALVRTFKTAADSKAPSALSSEGERGKSAGSLLRKPAGAAIGIVRRSEEENFSQTAYAAASPVILIAALVLAILASLGGNGRNFLHTLSALVCAGSSFAAFFSFPLPYALAARRLRTAGVAVAGYAGCADIGKTRRLVVSDEDLFPPGTMKFSEINVQDGFPIKQVVSCTASLIEASGSGAAHLFNELMERRGYHMPRTDEFKCHEGGGLSGLVNGDRVLVGSAGFMNLMGIRLPHEIQTKNAVCTAIEGELVGVFVIDYIPTAGVQEALITLSRGRTQTVFAIRDFNITPLMIKKLFRMPTDSFNFPSFRNRYRIAAETARDDTPAAAVITRAGMLPLAEAAEAGRKLYTTCRINTILSLLGGAVGMAIVFLLCRAGSFDTATAGNVLSFMLLWALPELILSIGQNR